jgi:hypothetical protein
MKLFLNGFWSGFKEKTEGVNYSVFEHILEKVFDSSFWLTENLNDADMLLECWFAPSVFNRKTWKYSIFFFLVKGYIRFRPT